MRYVVFTSFPTVKELTGVLFNHKKAEELARVANPDTGVEIIKSELETDDPEDLKKVMYMYGVNIIVYPYEEYTKSLEDSTYIPKPIPLFTEAEE